LNNGVLWAVDKSHNNFDLPSSDAVLAEGNQLTQPKGFGHIVVRAQFQADHLEYLKKFRHAHPSSISTNWASAGDSMTRGMAVIPPNRIWYYGHATSRRIGK
jgi:hypothetical protein